MLTLIKNGLVYDGTDAPPVKTDILVRGREISWVGTFTAKHADYTIDASNSIITPGFIDVNTSSDHLLSLFSEPAQEGFRRNGVTTIIGGNCGVSLAPLLGHPLEEAGLFGHPVTMNVGWSSVRELLALLEARGIGVNFGTLVGHGTLRRLMTHGEPRDLTEREHARFLGALETAYRDGAFGLSLGSDTSALRVPPKELATLAEFTARHKRIYALHLRDFESELPAAIREVVALAHATHVSVELCHLVPLVGHASHYAEALECIEHASATSLIHFDLYPFDTIERPLMTFLPSWARRGTAREVREVLTEQGAGDRLESVLAESDLRDLRIGHVFDNALRLLEGKTLASFAEERGRNPHAALLELMRLTGGAATVLERTVDTDMQTTFMKSQHALIASNAADVPAPTGLKRERDLHPSRRPDAGLSFLAWAEQTGALTLSQAVAKLTSLPARTYGLSRRGCIAEGYAADLVVLKKLVPTAVLINGVSVIADGAPVHALPGRALRAGA